MSWPGSTRRAADRRRAAPPQADPGAGRAGAQGARAGAGRSDRSPPPAQGRLKGAQVLLVDDVLTSGATSDCLRFRAQAGGREEGGDCLFCAGAGRGAGPRGVNWRAMRANACGPAMPAAPNAKRPGTGPGRPRDDLVLAGIPVPVSAPSFPAISLMFRQSFAEDFAETPYSLALGQRGRSGGRPHVPRSVHPIERPAAKDASAVSVDFGCHICGYPATNQPLALAKQLSVKGTPPFPAPIPIRPCAKAAQPSCPNSILPAS